MSTITVRLVNGFASGEESNHTVQVGTTAQGLVAMHIPSNLRHSVLLKVRRSGEQFGGQVTPLPADFMLADGDIVSAFPAKVTGNRHPGRPVVRQVVRR